MKGWAFGFGTIWGVIIAISIMEIAGLKDAADWGRAYADRVCEHGHKWESDMLYCLDENGNWIKQ